MKVKLSIFTLAIFFVFTSAANICAKTALNGKLLQSNGRPLPYTEIELVLVESEEIVNDGRLLAISSTSGKFSFINVPEGKYTLSINFNEKPTDFSPYETFFYPSTKIRTEAEVFDINEFSKFTPVTFQLQPKLVERKIIGQIVWSGGIPVADAFIYINDVQYDEIYGLTNLKSDKYGNFTIKAFENRKYIVGAVLFERFGRNLEESIGPVMASTRSEIFTLNANTENIKLIMEEPEELKTLRRKSIGKLIVKP